MATYADRDCAQCGTTFTPGSARGRFCSSTCRSRNHRGKTDGGDAAAGKSVATFIAPALAAAGDSRAPSGSVQLTPLAASVLQGLTTLKAHETIAGLAAVRVAQQIDLGLDSGAAIASLTRELSRLRAEAILEAAPLNQDGVDKITGNAQAKILKLVKSSA